MNIVYIEHYAGTPALGMEFRPYYLAREWVRTGHRVRMLAASYSHVRARQPEIGGEPKDETIDGIDYRWYPTSRGMSRHTPFRKAQMLRTLPTRLPW